MHSFRQINTKKLEFEDTGIKINAGIHFVAFAHILGWVKRDIGTIYVGFAYLNASQQSEIASRLANPTNWVADRRLNPTYDLSLRLRKWTPPIKNSQIGMIPYSK